MSLSIIILAGGYGTRISSVLGSTPKLLAPIGDTCFFDIFLRWIKKSIHPYDYKVIVATGFLHEKIAKYVDDQKLNITLSREVDQLGTLGAAYNASLIADSENLLILNGDTLFSFCIAHSLSEFYVDHQTRLFVKECVTNDRYGGYIYDMSSSRLVLSDQPNFISLGAVLTTKSLLHRICSNYMPLSLSKPMIDRDFISIVNSQPIVLPESTPFLDIGTPDSYQSAENYFSRYF